MNALIAPLRWLGSWLDRAFCAALALLLAQAPLYSEQYLDKLSAVRARTAEVYEEAVGTAQALNLNVEVYLRRERTQKPGRADSLALVEGTLRHHQAYVKAQQALERRSPWLRPIYLLSHTDPNLRAAMDYRPGWSFSWVVLGYAALGLTLGWLLTGLLGWLSRRQAHAV
jgi:hypothetical protein